MQTLGVVLATLAAMALALAEAPYPASGWRPQGKQFHLPTRHHTSYYRPGNDYGPPPPVPSSVAPSTTTSTEAETTVTTTEAQTTTAKVEDRSAALSEGVYYVLQPGGRLQRIAYAHGPAPARLQEQPQQQQPPGYLARFHYHDLEPLGAPIFSYASPQLVRVN